MEEGKPLRVAESYHRDVGAGIVRMGQRTLSELSLRSGDFVEIVGKMKTFAVVGANYPDDKAEGIIRMDGSLRANAGVGIDDKVMVRKIEARRAERVTFAPTKKIHFAGGEGYLSRTLAGRPLSKGQRVRVDVLDNVLVFVVISIVPKGPAVIDRNTEIRIRDKPIESELFVGGVSYEDIGGLSREIGLVREMVELPLRHPELFERLGIEPPKGVLLYGPPGTGKTLIAKAVANETVASFFSISGPEIMGKFYGESEERLRDIFEEAQQNAPSVVFIDELDALAPKREEVTGEVERRVVAQLLALMDGLAPRGQVVVIGATNRPNALDPALRRGGRFDREIEIGIPDARGRLEILHVHTRGMPLSRDVTDEFLKEIASLAHGYVGADIATMCKEAAMHALRRMLPEIDLESEEIPAEILERLEVRKEDLLAAMRAIEPSAMREVFMEVPHVSWEDVGGLREVKQELIEAVEWPFKYREAFDELNLEPPRGVLLFGPPGTGKTLLARAVASESQANFISIKGPELLSKWVGESEKAVREVFRRARQSAPVIVFFDEIDSIAPHRGISSDSHVSERVVSQLLTEIDGIEEMKDVVVMAATNRPELVEPSLLRQGRIERLVYVPPPTLADRKEIFSIHLRHRPTEGVDIERLAMATEGYTGADIAAVCREATMTALRQVLSTSPEPSELKRLVGSVRITMEHMCKALEKIAPSLTGKQLAHFEQMARQFARKGISE
ncbi:CDC48 family AAA ATPase [Methermicoccus shengliensis]|uniref:CDC48 family AAA ATPase n=1 Tax=Methermicoccus shengliensis TaxID=660064 RepID=A0A832RXK0_9EURY|nr:CDC48 family AAA ATPase [Methermicoccus shengliensis]HIH70256.1 CDC48 family AAA ATPase [Methermicoccus shengliensis]